MHKEKKIGQKRAFLNMPYKTSVVSIIGYQVEIDNCYNDQLGKEDLFTRANIEFKMSDCVRSIELDFNIDTKEDMANSLFKLNTIIDICESMKKDLKSARFLIVQGQKRQEEIEKEKKCSS